MVNAIRNVKKKKRIKKSLLLYNTDMALLRKVEPFLVVILFSVFIYFRILPIINQTVPYTYDQGRDFLQAEQIVRYRNLTLIGPTTGSQGIFHGVWWYYLLSIFYIVFRGLPLGFYWGLFLLALASTFLFYWFLKNEFGSLASLIFLSVVSISPYFIKLAFFPGNNTVVPVFVLLFIYSLYQFFKTKKGVYIFLLSLSLGFIFEFEVAFGAFIIPSFLITIVLFKEFKNMVKNSSHIAYFLSGLSIPFLPRIVFELKYQFLQSKSAIYMFDNPVVNHPQDVRGFLIDRIHLISNYYLNMFDSRSVVFALVMLLFGILGILFGVKTLKKEYKGKVIFFLIFLLFFLFLLTLFYKNSFFWDYYLEGIQYIFLFIVIAGLTSFFRIKYLFHGISIIAGLFFITAIYTFVQEISYKKTPSSIGLKAHLKIVEYVLDQSNKKDFCVRVYTPPVIPHTYNYLFNYYTLKGYKKPSTSFVNKSCWYIVEPDTYEFRIATWRKENIPKAAKLLETKQVENNVRIELWEKNI